MYSVVVCCFCGTVDFMHVTLQCNLKFLNGLHKTKSSAVFAMFDMTYMGMCCEKKT